MNAPDLFVTTAWLAARIGDPAVIVLDASWYLPTEARDPYAEYLDSHLPGARFFDIDRLADRATDLPHMLPAPEEFAQAVGALGIGNDCTVVVYDELGLRSGPRVRWTFAAMGFERVLILEGGGPRWRAEGRPLESGMPAAVLPAIFTANYCPALVRDFSAMLGLSAGGAQIADARPADRFAGAAPEPRPGLRLGHIPGSVNVPVGLLSRDGALKPVAELREIFAERGLDLARPVVTTCGSGITAATLALALEAAGARDVAVYDGSWAEWGARPDTPVATG